MIVAPVGQQDFQPFEDSLEAVLRPCEQAEDSGGIQPPARPQGYVENGV